MLIVVLVLMHYTYGDEDFYTILGVGKDANEPEIKRAFRKMSKLYHPDKNPGMFKSPKQVIYEFSSVRLGDEQAGERFKKINRANEVLTNPDKRHIYDNYGEDGLERFER